MIALCEEQIKIEQSGVKNICMIFRRKIYIYFKTQILLISKYTHNKLILTLIWLDNNLCKRKITFERALQFCEITNVGLLSLSSL